MKWPEYPLARVADGFLSGGTPSTKRREYWDGNIPWITGADFLDGEVLLGRRSIRPIAVEKSATNVVPAGAILMVTRTGVGKIAIAPVDIAISQDITAILPNQVITPRFLIAAIRHRMKLILSAQRGATIKGVTRRDVEELPVPLPPPSEQRRIVEILDQADVLRKKRAEADAKARQILPALFHKMFGESRDHAKNWTRRTLASMLSKEKGALQSGPFGSNLHNHDFVPDGTILAVGIDNVHNTGFELGRQRRITEEKYEELEKYTLLPGDVLITIMGTIGRTCVFPEWAGKAICTKHVYRMRVNTEVIAPEYLSASIRFCPQVRAQLGASTTGQIVRGITSKALRSLDLVVPPIDQQRTFTSIKERLSDEMKRQRLGQESLDALFASLLHRAFSGDLTAQWREAHMKELLQEMEQQAKILEASHE